MARDGDASAARICVTNAKGGTGKTTIAINVAGALNDRGRDVLFVDLDPQGNATEGLGLLSAYDEPPPSLFDALTGGLDADGIRELVVSHAEMDVLPSNVDMLQAEHELTVAELISEAADGAVDVDPADLAAIARSLDPDEVGTEHALGRLDTVLSAIDSTYDYVIIDSPPFYGQLTDAGIYAAGNVIVPALTEASSERPIELLITQLAALEEQAGITVTTRGVVANRIEETNEDATMLRWLQQVFEDFPVWEVRKRVALQRAHSAGHSLFEYDEETDMTEVFEDIAADLDRQFDRPEVPA